ncbi:MAG: ABC transporter substrate-binding protein [Candidatus Lambdaproteobacteria bacterium]|nr:ABC transporter substrate-binding protein [Candidatus Lambdaproteobacteria bacterium]
MTRNALCPRRRSGALCRALSLPLAALLIALIGLVPAASAQKRGGVLSAVLREDPTGFDLLGPKKASWVTQSAMSFTHNRLFMYPEDDRREGGVVGDLVESWSQPSPTVYLLKLHQGVRFHPKPPVNGRELTAEDVRWTFERVMKSPEARLFKRVKNVVAVDPYTVRFELSAPFGPFLPNLAATTIVIYAKESGKPCDTCNGGRDFTAVNTAVGTGPFMLEEYQEGQKLVFKRHPNYFRKGRPYLDGINLYIMKDNAAQMAALRTGKVQLLEAWNRVDHQMAQEAKEFPRTVVELFPIYATGENIVGRVDKKPWNDLRVRRAVSLAIDREGWLKGLWPMGGKRLSGPIPNASAFDIPEDKLGDLAKWYRYDVAEAKRLLAQAGYPNGFKGKLITTVGYGPDYTSRTALIKDMLGRVGIELEIVAQEYPQWIKHTYAGNFSEWSLVHIPQWGLGDEDEWLGSYTPGDTRNHTHLNDPETTRLVEQSRNVATIADRTLAIQSFQRRFHDQMYRVFLPFQNFVLLRRDNVMGFVPKIKGYDFGKRFETVWLE